LASDTGFGEAWSRNWRERLTEELDRLGLSSLREFSRLNRCATFPDISATLAGPFAPIQIMMAIRGEYLKEINVGGFAADSLCRYLKEYLSSHTAAQQREVAGALAIGVWGGAMGKQNEASVFEVWRILKPKILTGWLPVDDQDPDLRAAISSHSWDANFDSE
jgi:hypothetical protein